MSQATLYMTGLSRADESLLHGQLEQAKALLQTPWRVTPEAEASVLLIDMDSMYGQMALMKALGSDKPLIALTEGARADTPYLLRRPSDAAALATLLNTIAAERGLAAPASATPAVAPAKQAAAPAPALATPVAAPTPVAALAPAAAPVPATASATPSVDAVASIDLLARYKLERWPSIDRGFPKHFRIATVMLKAPASPAEIAEASGASVPEVCEFIVARMASGHAIRT